MAPQAAAPLQSMNAFMNRGVGANGLPVEVQRLSNFTGIEEEPVVKFSNVSNTFEHEAIAKENAASLVEARKHFSINPGTFTSAKGRQAKVNANNARLNAEWFARYPKVAHLPEATRTATGKKSALKKEGGRKTRKNRR